MMTAAQENLEAWGGQLWWNDPPPKKKKTNEKNSLHENAF